MTNNFVRIKNFHNFALLFFSRKSNLFAGVQKSIKAEIKISAFYFVNYKNIFIFAMTFDN